VLILWIHCRRLLHRRRFRRRCLPTPHDRNTKQRSALFVRSGVIQLVFLVIIEFTTLGRRVRPTGTIRWNDILGWSASSFRQPASGQGRTTPVSAYRRPMRV
jgi:hypothetical protein